MLDRRALIKLGLYGGSGALLHLTQLKSGAWGWALDEDDRTEHEKEDEHHRRHRKSGGGIGGPNGSPPMQPFSVGLPLPPAATKVNPSTLPGIPNEYNTGAQGFDGVPTSYYQVTERQAPVQIYPAGMPSTMVWGFSVPTITPGGQTYLGPTFVADIGERVYVRINNNLGPNITSIVHHHGAHVGSDWDGSALWSQQIHNGTFKDFVYPNDDDIAATHWYHDHDIDLTGHNVFMGLEGFFLLHDAPENALNLPGNPNDPAPAGELPFDLPLVFQDRTFDANAQLVYNPFASRGFLGDMFLVNGAIQPKIRAANRKYRLRILNGSNARFYQFMLQTNTGATIPFNIIGSDGGLYETAVQTDSFLIAPAERVEVVVDFTGLATGTQVMFNNCMMQTDGRKPAGLVANCATVPQTPGPDGVGTICRFDIAFSVKDPSSFTPGQALRNDVPVYLESQALPPVPGTKPGATRDWRFERGQGGEWLVTTFDTTVNPGLQAMPFDPGPPPPAPENPRIDATCKVGTTEIWRLINGSGGWAHPVHIHRNQFRILDRVDSGSGHSLGLLPTQLGLKDVFRLEQNVTIRLISKYTSGPTSDKQTGKYVMHCHNVEHEDMAMMIVWECTP
jgi:FtsP/CotA-like multicopper oxidase with cupredoxin domain